MPETQKNEWTDPYAQYWAKELVGKSVVLTVHPDGAVQGTPPSGFVVAKVIGQEGDVLDVDLGPDRPTLEIHRNYVHRVLLDDEPEPDTLGDLKRL